MDQILYTITRIALFVYPALQVITIVVGIIFVISGVTDFGFDLYFIARSIRRFFLSRKWPKLTLERLQAREQQKIAIFIGLLARSGCYCAYTDQCGGKTSIS